MNVLGCGLGEAYGPFWASVSMAYSGFWLLPKIGGAAEH